MPQMVTLGAAEELLVRMMTETSLTCRTGDFGAAKAKYLQIVTKVVGSACTIPMVSNEVSGGIICELYLEMDLFTRVNLMGCCVGIAKCLRREKKLALALAWCDEVNALYRSGIPKALPQPVYDEFIAYHPVQRLNFAADWLDWLPQLPEFALYKATALCLAPEILAELGNSGTATTRRWNAHKTSKNLPMTHQTAALFAMLQGRHPDPQAPLGNGGCVAGLHIKGSWARLSIGKLGGVIDGHEAFACFIWNSHLYVAGGRTTVDGPFHQDMWALDLNALDAWRELPPYPVHLSGSRRFIDWTMLVHNDAALLFTGHSTIDVFDLVTERWTSFQTTYTPTPADREAGIVDMWPYPRKQSRDGTVIITGNKLYSAQNDGARIYLLFGHFGREAANHHNELHGAGEAFGHEDFWSWGVKEESWRRERMGERATQACVVVFGGYHPTLPTHVVTAGNEVQFNYSYFADTFIYDMTPTADAADPPRLSRKWQQVRTAGFPTYRCQAQLAVDSATGKTYMFGGWTNNQYIPTRTKLMSRSFGYLCELRVNLPRGHFEEADVEEEARVAKAGPWQRCFSCASAGPWKRCGGSCNGKAFFCGTPCFREGWAEHKLTHKCRKA
ncbi:hypothetical protein C8F04DRAFT_1220966 [Mycena alexandri]|uniref:Uncharacterized protein n=1 Tax=Mycena alexandri TaxID=1745969 RepID=A0AAD6X8S8_9AGAR|nr:hypothetical protein C8F04DRAFT_1220966 [Mycena alexandri]